MFNTFIFYADFHVRAWNGLPNDGDFRTLKGNSRLKIIQLKMNLYV